MDKENKEIGRREFLKKTAIAATTVLAADTAHAQRIGEAGNPERHWGMILDLKRCVACKACAIACKLENKTPPGVAYGVFIEEEKGEFPHVSRNAFFRPCMQCGESSCTKVCPTGATYQRVDGIVPVDYKRCIGCRYCIAACPYGARSFDYGHDYVEKSDNPYNSIPSPEYGAIYGVREKGKSPVGNVRKCTFCLHLQDEKGEYKEVPACARTCMGRVIHFGDLNDPEAFCLVHGEKMQELLSRRGHYRLKEEIGNEPSVYYIAY